MYSNGLEPLARAAEELAEKLRAIREDVLSEQRQAIYKERETMTVNYRVQKRIGAEAETLAELERAIARCELALLELDAIALEWGQYLHC
jgi:preprotein translocase subunit SecA